MKAILVDDGSEIARLMLLLLCLEGVRDLDITYIKGGHLQLTLITKQGQKSIIDPAKIVEDWVRKKIKMDLITEKNSARISSP